MQMPGAEHAAAIACACWAGTGLTSSSERFPHQMFLFTFKGLGSATGRFTELFITISSRAACSRNITCPFPVIFRLESFVVGCFLGFFAELSHSLCTEQSCSCTAFAWHTSWSANNVSLHTQSKPTFRQYFSLTAWELCRHHNFFGLV